MLVSARLRKHSTRPAPQLPSNTTPQACCYRTQRRDTDLGMVVRETGPIKAVTTITDTKHHKAMQQDNNVPHRSPTITSRNVRDLANGKAKCSNISVWL